MQRAMNELMRDIFGCEHDNRLRPETDEKVRHTSSNDAPGTNFIAFDHSIVKRRVLSLEKYFALSFDSLIKELIDVDVEGSFSF